MFFFRRPVLPAFVRAYEAGPWPAPRAPWREVEYVVLDVETSGLDPRRDALLSIGLVGVVEGRVRLDRRWSSLVRPPEGLLVGGDSIRIHGLLRAELAEAPQPAEVLTELLGLLAGRALVVHVAGVDVAFLNAALRRHFGARLRGPILDTARLAMTLHERAQLLGEVAAGTPAPPAQLRALAERLGLPVFGEHDALGDALTTAQVFLAQATRLAQQGTGTLRGLLRAGGV